MTFVVAALTLESGVLVWVVIATAWIVGLRGVSTRGAGRSSPRCSPGTSLLRFWYLDTGSAVARRSARPDSCSSASTPSELQQRFGDRRVVFYAYNVAASLLSVLLSEPRDGLFVAARAWRGGDVHPHAYLTVLSSLAMTMVMVWAAFTWWRRGSTLRPERTTGDRGGRRHRRRTPCCRSHTPRTTSLPWPACSTRSPRSRPSARRSSTRRPAASRAGCSSRRRCCARLGVGDAQLRRSPRHRTSTRSGPATTGRSAAALAGGGTLAEGAAAGSRSSSGCGMTRSTAEVPNPQMLPEWRGQWFGD